LADPIVAFFHVFKGAVEGLNLYPPGNPVIARQFENLLQLLPQVSRQGQLSWALGEGLFLFNGEAQGEAVVRSLPVRWVSKTLYERHIDAITIDKAVTQTEMEQLGRVLSRLPAEFPNANSAGQMLAQAKVRHIQINPMPAGKAERPDRELASAPLATGQMTPVLANPEALPMAGIPEDEIFALKKTVSSLILSDRGDKVQEILHHMHGDLFVRDRRTRELAQASLSIALGVLINLDQEPILLSLFKNMPKDLAQLEDQDLFEAHLLLFSQVVDYLFDKMRIGPLLAGLDYLGEGANLDPMRRQAAQTRLGHILSQENFEKLIRATHGSVEWKARFQTLCEKHGIHMVRAMLKVLFQSAERPVRHFLITLLSRMGAAIHPELLEAAEIFAGSESPWYIRRNLLQLFGARPPGDLFPFLKDMVSESEHPKVRDLALRALFALSGKEPTTLGIALLHGSKGETLQRMVGYVGQGGIKTYCQELVDLASAEIEEALRSAAMKAISQLDVHDGNQFLLQTLSADSLFASKGRQNLRIMAAEALIQSQSQAVRRELARFVNDRNKEVRDLLARHFT